MSEEDRKKAKKQRETAENAVSTVEKIVNESKLKVQDLLT